MCMKVVRKPTLEKRNGVLVNSLNSVWLQTVYILGYKGAHYYNRQDLRPGESPLIEMPENKKCPLEVADIFCEAILERP